MYKCKIMADSLSPQGNRLTTFLVTYPRIVHAEMLRHRMFSHNVASSRAIPFEKMVKDVEENPFIPIAWQFGHKGMQGTEYVTEESDLGGITARNESWLSARDYAIQQAKDLNSMDTTKQLCNRLLEPFMWTTELITTSKEGLHNFFELRCPKYKSEDSPVFKSKKDCIDFINYQGNNVKVEDYDEIHWLKWNISQAEIHIQKIAEMMWDAYNESEPKDLEAGEWHIPFGDSIDENRLDKIRIYYRGNTEKYESDEFNFKIKIAIARCARLSYTTLGDNPKVDYEADIKLHDRLLESHHMSPFEHCARAMSNQEYYSMVKGSYPTQEDNWGIVNMERYPITRKGLLREMGFENINPNNPDIYGWCNNFRGFIQYRYLVENE